MTSRRVVFASLSFAIVAFVLASAAEARLTPPAPVQPASLTTNLGGDCCAPKPACCPKPCITYRHRGPKLCCGCEPPVKTAMVVKDPCTGCETEIEVCLPACCKGDDQTDDERGRGLVHVGTGRTDVGDVGLVARSERHEAVAVEPEVDNAADDYEKHSGDQNRAHHDDVSNSGVSRLPADVATARLDASAGYSPPARSG